MQVYLTLARRELGTFFYSWIGYIVIAGTVFLTGLGLYLLLDKLQAQPISMPITEVFFNFLFWLILLFAAPVITMRLFALEKFSGTFETLMTAPVGDVTVVLAKFTVALFFFMVMWLPLVGCVFVLRYFTQGSNLVNPATLASTFLGIFLVGCLYMSIGCFASALTRNQVVAAMISFAIGVVFFLLSFLGDADDLSLGPTWVARALGDICVWRQMLEFARGVVDSRYIVFYVTATIFFLFLTCRVVESRRWK
jgi:ABC-2 type transport system permease protein